MSGMDDVKKESKKKGLYAAGMAAGTVTLAAVGAPVLAAAAGVGTAVLTYRWFAHRAKWGLRF